MNRGQRRRYHVELWPAACAAQGWDPRDEERRRSVTKYAIGVDSTTDLTQAQITALFTFLDHLADPHDAEKAHEWEICHQDPEKYNRLRQAEYWRRRAGYKPTGKLEKERFGVFFKEQLEAEQLSDAQVDQMLLTNRERALAHRRIRRPERAHNRINRDLIPF